jgi:GMP synthase-like glutamine amidotransferase
MKVLIIKNIACEGPGTIEEHLRAEKLPYSTIDLKKGEAAPHINTFTHLVIMGGPMAVYEMEQHPFLKDETLLIESAIKANKHVLGVCLGAQMVAHALGARVYAGGQKEIGWYEVTLTDDGMRDPCVSQLAYDGRKSAQVFQWHGDTFDLPAGAVRLASSDLYPNQAFRYSDRVYALQFHIEVSPVIVFDWLKDEQGVDLNSVNAESNRIYDPYRMRAMNFYRRFFRP